ncbi:K+ transporter Trk [Tetragenococcus halophilus subsp. flandriensis]|uniref:TrkH family potassium uptake protein n=1 Tax=Tetragenococcus halophilus TaxID=51669 RepID=UPI0023E967A4|nr:TrkH family potassium uptake protein [Tetragenococcus halophilus]GMA08232.1 K+ transporter Trk [Tetragenococcus halophilus subsp. flandriensis]
MSHLDRDVFFKAPQQILLGFASIILLGTFILMLPFATRSGHSTNFLDALFTATSAVCVTGLTTVSTAGHWNMFGQAVILLLIEVGGLGFMSLPILYFTLTKRKINLSMRMVLKDSLNTFDMSGTVGLMFAILRIAFIIQFLGFLLLSVDFIPRFGWEKGLWYSFFHAVSSFCNAGFDLFGNSMISFQNDPWVLMIISFLIIAGGLGFIVWQDLLKNKTFKKLRLHSQITLKVTGILLVLGSIFFYFTNTIGSNGLLRLSNAFFLAVTPRTAGFFSIDYAMMSPAGLVLTMILMFIGGSSGSTAGGFKTTTLGIILIKLYSVIRGRSKAQYKGRTIKENTISQAFMLFFIFLIMIISSTMILSVTETIPNVYQLGLEYIVFEVISAMGTVGLSLGLSAHLTWIGKLVLIFLMFIGRVGILTMIFSTINQTHKRKTNYKYPEENVIIG